jgi:hypothetical protein
MKACMASRAGFFTAAGTAVRPSAGMSDWLTSITPLLFVCAGPDSQAAAAAAAAAAGKYEAKSQNSTPQASTLVYVLAGAAAALAIALVAASVVIFRQHKQLVHGKASAAASSAAASGYPVFAPLAPHMTDIMSSPYQGQAGGGHVGVRLPGNPIEAKDKASWVLKI